MDENKTQFKIWFEKEFPEGCSARNIQFLEAYLLDAWISSRLTLVSSSSFKQDFFCEFNNVYNRLENEYKKHKKIIVAFDFDDTIFNYHSEDRTYDNVINLLKKCKKLNFTLTLFTARKDHKIQEAIDYCKSIEIEPDYVNSTPAYIQFGNVAKPYYNILLDDRAGLTASFAVLTLLIQKIEQNLI